MIYSPASLICCPFRAVCKFVVLTTNSKTTNHKQQNYKQQMTTRIFLTLPMLLCALLSCRQPQDTPKPAEPRKSEPPIVETPKPAPENWKEVKDQCLSNANTDIELNHIINSTPQGVNTEDLDGDKIPEKITESYIEITKRIYNGSFADIYPKVIFKCDPQQQKYVIATHLFADWVLKELERENTSPNEEITDDPSLSKAENLAFRQELILRDVGQTLFAYFWIGEPEKAWAYFHKNYHEADKRQARQRIQKVLNEHPVYAAVMEAKRRSNKP